MSVYEQEQGRRIAALTVECFQSRVVLDFRCERNGPPVSAYEYLLCRYFQDSLLESSGTTNPSATEKARARMATDSLKALLAMMLGDFADQGYDVTTLMKNWSSQLRQFDRATLSVTEFVARQLGDCYRRAQNHVER